jgi:formylglycine-generating enzyme required for sulfatase activity
MPVEDAALNRALTRYLKWVRAAQRTVVVRGMLGDHTSVASYDLMSTYLPLMVEARTGYGTHMTAGLEQTVGLETEGIDFSPLSPGKSVNDPAWLGEIEVTYAERIISQSPMAVLSGGPGSGKTTALQYITAVLAEAALDPASDEARGKLGISENVPVPVYLPLAAYASYLEEFEKRRVSFAVERATLLSYAAQYMESREAYLDLPVNFFGQLLQREVPIALLLDGLDEIPDDELRVYVSRATQDIAQTPYSCSIVISSRPTAYRGDVVLPPYFTEYRLLPLTGTQVEVLLDRICGSLYGTKVKEARENADILKTSLRALERHDGGYSPAERVVDSPLMVRMLITLHITGQQIAEHRSELFSQYVESLIAATYHPDTAVAHRLSRTAGPSALQQSLLAHLAFEVHLRGSENNGNIGVDDLYAFALSHLSASMDPPEAVKAATRFIEATRQRGGLLLSEGARYRFAHLAIQEFLVARYLAETMRPHEIVSFFETQGRTRLTWWREPLIMCVGYLSTVSPGTSRELIAELAHLIGSMPTDSQLELAELEAAGAACANWQPTGPLPAELADHMALRLFVDEVGYESTALRASVSFVLGRLGDPRPTVAGAMPETIAIPAGRFVMGNVAGTVVHLSSLQTGTYEQSCDNFVISRYPITNGQFAHFIESGAYTDSGQRYWSPSGIDWKSAYEIREPAYWRDTMWNGPAQPVVGVSWFEAIAFCNWLTEFTGRACWLPSDKEWEYSARGSDGRAWPWGDQWVSYAANTIEAGLQKSTIVGLFDRFSSPFGLGECAGNVWEWCSSEFRGYGPYADDDGRESADGVMPRVIRGGSWLNGRDHARCSNRDHYSPGDRHFDLGFRIKVAV